MDLLKLNIQMKLIITTLTTFLIIFCSYAQTDVDFTASPLEICVGEEVQFEDLSSPTGTITNWTWDVGDGSPFINEQNPTHVYTEPGNIQVILTITDDNGTESEVKSDFIKVNPLPEPAFTPSILGGCSIPSEVTMTNVSPSSGAIYDWDFGNGTTSTGVNPDNVTYNSEGSYDITLTVEDDATGCVNSVVETVDIFDYGADFSLSSATACENTSIDFEDDSSPGTNQWSWNFGDGTTSSSQNPSHTFNTEGTYTVTLTATNSANGCTDTYSEEIEVFPLPTPSFDFEPGSGCAPLEVDFTNTSNGDGTFEWDFGDGGTQSGENPSNHTYTDDGDYSVTLTQTDGNGCSNAVTLPNIISVSSVNAEFEADVDEGCEVLDVVFTNSSSSPNPDDPITGWEWDFGDGSTFDGETPPTHSYNEGVYDVTLIITTDAGCSDTLTIEEYISVGIPPDVDFSWDPIQDCAKSEWEFTNLTTISVDHEEDEVDYQWEFGDGGNATDKDPTYSYPQDTGYFDVQLIVLFRGCPDTMKYDSAVYVDAPIALFDVEDGNIFCNESIPLAVTFNDQAIVGKETDDAEMIWDWGDGNTETATPPDLYGNNPGEVIHSYGNTGTYIIKQVVHNYTTGCSDSIENTIYISEVKAFFNISEDSICATKNVTLTDNSSYSTFPPLTYRYDMGNGDFVNGPSGTYTYNTPGTYDITLTVTDGVGCQDSQVFSPFEVLARPQAIITPDFTAGCAPLGITFTNSSIGQSGIPLETFDWTFEDGTTETTTAIGETTSYTFNEEGVFLTQLVVTDEFGCVSLTGTEQTTITKPVALFDIPAVVCNEETFTALNNSVDYTSSEWFINTTATSTNDDLTTSFNHLGTETDLSFINAIELIVTDQNGCKDTLEHDVTVSAPYVDFDFEFNGANVNDEGDFVCPPVFAHLTDLSASYGDITNWQWDFTNGNFSSLQDPNTTYVFAGTYSGSLVITDEFGCTDSIIYEDYLTIGGPSGELEWESIGTLCDLEYVFTPSELNGVVDIMWIMGDGDTLTSMDEFNYTYDDVSTYTPIAILINEDNCNIPYELDPIVISSGTLNAYFEINPMAVNWGEPAIVSDFSTGGSGGIVDWFWDAGGDQFNNDGGSFEYFFNASGDVVVSLTVTDAEGCQDTYQIVVDVTDLLTIPNVFTPNNDGSNDVFVLIDNAYKEYTVTILNRWGNVVSESYIVEDNHLWDGLNRNDQECTEGVYFYKINGIQRDGEPREEHGFVHLVRDND